MTVCEGIQRKLITTYVCMMILLMDFILPVSVKANGGPVLVGWIDKIYVNGLITGSVK